MGDAIPVLRPRRTLNGKFDAYCRQCWFAVYAGWIGDDDPCGRCIEGKIRPDECRTAIATAHDIAAFAELRRHIRDNPA